MAPTSHTLSPRLRLLAVFAGGFCGTILRVLLSTLLISRLGKGWPYDILGINLSGAFLLALLTTLADATVLIGPTRRLFCNVGLIGAYTTFSSLALGDALLFTAGHWLPALGYLLASGGGGILAILVGMRLGQQWVLRARRAQGASTRLHASQVQALSGQEESALLTQKLDLQPAALVAENELHE